jgi:hypothetical protein
MRKQEAPHKVETSLGMNPVDMIKPSKLTFAMLKKTRKTEPTKEPSQLS